MRSIERAVCFATAAEQRGGHGLRVARWFLPAYLAALLAIVLLRAELNLPPALLTVLDAVFLIAVPAVVGILGLSSFLAGGFLPILLLGAGILSQALASLMSIVMRDQSLELPIAVMVFDGGLWLAGYFHVANVVACMGGGVHVQGQARRWSAVGIGAVGIGAVLMVSALLSQGALPYDFFGPLANPVAMRFVLVTSSLPFAAAAIGAWSLRRQTSRIFLGWYALALMTIALGRATELLTGPPEGSLYLLARAAYYAAGAFMLLAVVQSAGSYRGLGQPLPQILTRFLHDTGITYQSLVEISTEAMLALDPSGRVRYWNPAAGRLLGEDRLRADANLADLAADEGDRETLRGSLRGLLYDRGGEAPTPHMETSLRGRDDRVFPAEISLLARRLDLGVDVALIEDITARKETERALQRANADASRRARLLQQLTLELTQAEQRERRRLALLLHDHLQQLLVAAKLNLAHHQQRSGGDRGLVDTAAEQLQEAIEASRSLAVEISPPVLQRGGFAAALEWLRDSKRRKYGLQVKLEVETDVEPEGAIRDLLFQALRELLFNVVKHAQTERAWVRIADDGDDAIQVEVRDDGVGCDPAEILEREPGDSGFGLFSISQRLEALGGRLTVDCPESGGTRLTMRAPLRRAAPMIAVASAPTRPLAAAPARRRSDLAPKTGALRILVADDHEFVRQGVIALLNDQPDFQVVGEAATSEEALAAAVRLRPDIVVLDVSLERPLSGVQAARDLVATIPGLVVVGLTMHDERAVHRAMRSAGAVACLLKSRASEELLQTLRWAAGTRGSRRAAAGEPAGDSASG